MTTCYRNDYGRVCKGISSIDSIRIVANIHSLGASDYNIL